MTIGSRTDYCGRLGASDAGRSVTLMGWVHRRRDHGGLLFFDLRDISGLVQVVVDPDHGDAFAAAVSVRPEYVLAVHGVVRPRPAGMENPDLATGAVEVVPDALEVLSRSERPPFMTADQDLPDELIRLRYRYLDLRRPRLQENLRLRDMVTYAAREFLHQQGFLEVETPTLARSTPEGARDFLVPSRIHPGRFYALPQSPQIFKQLLMVAGLDRYYQIVKVYRDEDLRADRQPEFTQIDIETSFLNQHAILRIMEELVQHVFRRALAVELDPFTRMTYDDAMRLYGSDKPDLRAGPALLTLPVRAERYPERSPLAQVERLVAVRAVQAAFSRRELDALVAWAEAEGFPGLIWAAVAEEGRVRSNAARLLGEDGLLTLAQDTDLQAGDTVFVVAGSGDTPWRQAGQLRLKLARDRGLSDEGWRFLWVTDFPLFEQDGTRIKSAHHPFTMPLAEDMDRIDTDPLAVRSQAYDVVLNGVELASGSVRIHNPELQARIFRVLGLSEVEIEQQFGFLVNAFRYGAPPHGGIAFGLDRLVMMMAGATNIRDVIAFPKTTSASDAMMEAPSPVSPSQLAELGVLVRDPESSG
jgi:aspartyl-tRNA synthetase